MSAFGWDQMTDWWDENIGDEGDLWHRALIDPPLLRLVGEVSGMYVLDFACGNGYLSRRFTLATSTRPDRLHTRLPPLAVLVFSHLESLGPGGCRIRGARTN